MNRRFTLALVILLAVSEVKGCLNGEFLSLKDGYVIYEDHEGFVPVGHDYYVDDSLFEIERHRLDSLYKQTNQIDYLSDQGILLILLKRYEDAIQLYLKIEDIAPNRYSTASNIGTAYELAGNNKEALKWISRAVELNSASHHSSEWIHVKILEAKLGGHHLITSSFLLNTDFGAGDVPVSALSHEELLELRNQLYYQLNERVSFVQPKDEIVALLMYDLGNVSYLLKEYSDAEADYKKAGVYGYSSKLLDLRLKTLSPWLVVSSAKIKEIDITSYYNFIPFALGGITILIIAFLIVLFIKRAKR